MASAPSSSPVPISESHTSTCGTSNNSGSVGEAVSGVNVEGHSNDICNSNDSTKQNDSGNNDNRHESDVVIDLNQQSLVVRASVKSTKVETPPPPPRRSVAPPYTSKSSSTAVPPIPCRPPSVHLSPRGSYRLQERLKTRSKTNSSFEQTKEVTEHLEEEKSEKCPPVKPRPKYLRPPTPKDEEESNDESETSVDMRPIMNRGNAGLSGEFASLMVAGEFVALDEANKMSKDLGLKSKTPSVSNQQGSHSSPQAPHSVLGTVKMKVTIANPKKINSPHDQNPVGGEACSKSAQIFDATSAATSMKVCRKLQIFVMLRMIK